MNAEVAYFESAVRLAQRQIRSGPAVLRDVTASAFATAAYCEIVRRRGPREAAAYFYEMADAAAALDATRTRADFRFKLPGGRRPRVPPTMEGFVEGLTAWAPIWMPIVALALFCLAVAGAP